MTHITSMNQKRTQTGVGLVEVLVTMIVMGVGMLGIASLYVTTLQAKTTSGSRMRATNLVYDMADRIRANPQAGASYAMKPSDKLTQVSCSTADCTPKNMAAADKYEWMQLVTSPATGMPGATAQIDDTPGTDTAPELLNITVNWTEPNTSGTLSYATQIRLCDPLVTTKC